MHHLGEVLEIRDNDPIRPVRVQLEFASQVIDVGWITVSHGAWATVIFGKVAVGDWVQVWDTDLERHVDQYIVTAFMPTEENPLLKNDKILARDGDKVQINGAVFVTPKEALPISQNAVPGKLDLPDTLKGEITVKKEGS
jgi:hypothetical protein